MSGKMIGIEERNAHTHTGKRTIKRWFQVRTPNQNLQSKLSKLQPLICGQTLHMAIPIRRVPRRVARIYLPQRMSLPNNASSTTLVD